MARCESAYCDGIATCDGCNGHGVLRMSGKRYRKGSKHVLQDAPAHAACHGTGMVECGCVELDDATRATLSRDVEIEARHLQPGTLVRIYGGLYTVARVAECDTWERRRVIWQETDDDIDCKRSERFVTAGAAPTYEWLREPPVDLDTALASA